VVPLETAETKEEVKKVSVKRRIKQHTVPAEQLKRQKRQDNVGMFFRLPQEFRNEVYHYLWQYTPLLDNSEDPTNLLPGRPRPFQEYRVLYDPSTTDVWPPDWRKSRSALPRRLLSSRDFLQKGMAQLRFKGRWAIDSNPMTGKTGQLFPEGLSTPLCAQVSQNPQ
jgi:hypothetical protein